MAISTFTATRPRQHCNNTTATLQCAATWLTKVCARSSSGCSHSFPLLVRNLFNFGSHGSIVSTLLHTATHGNTQQHTATHCNTLHHTATHCITLQHTATYCNALPHSAAHCLSRHELFELLQFLHRRAHCNTLRHSATHCIHLHPYIHTTFFERTQLLHKPNNCSSHGRNVTPQIPWSIFFLDSNIINKNFPSISAVMA